MKKQKVIYYPFTRKQRLQLPLEFLYFEKVLSAPVQSSEKEAIQFQKLKMSTFYKPIISY